MRGLAVLRDHASRRDVLNTLDLFQSLRSATNRLSDSSNFPPYHCHNKSPVIHVRRKAISLAAACCASVIAVNARDACEMHSVSNVSFGSEFGRSSANVFDFQQAAHNRETLAIQVFRH